MRTAYPEQPAGCHCSPSTTIACTAQTLTLPVAAQCYTLDDPLDSRSVRLNGQQPLALGANNALAMMAGTPIPAGARCRVLLRGFGAAVARSHANSTTKRGMLPMGKPGSRRYNP
jgi:hypothetical protein